jgi:hypothetical protein
VPWDPRHFLRLVSPPLKPQVRRDRTPSWSWSGWKGGSWPNISNWYTHNVQSIRKAQRARTWIIWYQRIAHDSAECVRVWTPKKQALPSSQPRNFYGSHVKDRFPFDCAQTLPTPRTLVGAPEYYKDTHEFVSGSGFLQFWTVSVIFKLDTPMSTAPTGGPEVQFPRVGIFGRDGRELGALFVSDSPRFSRLTGEHEFVLLCEGRDGRAETGRQDDEEGWKYMVMLIEWHGEWAERVAIGSVEKTT